MAVLTDLPPDALLCLFSRIVATANTGHLLRLALVCKQFLELVAHADWFWQQQSSALGWIRTGFEHPPPAEPPVSTCHHHPVITVNFGAPSSSSTCNAAEHADAPAAASALGAFTTSNHTEGATPAAATAAAAAGCHVTRLWFEYYCLRMSCRWRLRLLVRKYIPFLNIQSRLAMQAGASIQQLEAVEASLTMRLPWELWELYRFRAGQAPGAGVSFAESCRCLGVHELHVASFTASSQPSLSPEGPATQQQQLAAVEAQLPALSCQPPHCQHNISSCQHGQHNPGSAAAMQISCSAGQQAAHAGGLWDPSTEQMPHDQPLMQHPSTMASRTDSTNSRPAGQHGSSGSCQLVNTAGAERDVHGVVFLSNTMGSLQYVVSQDSSVYLKRGFTTRRVASNLTGFMQHLLA